MTRCSVRCIAALALLAAAAGVARLSRPAAAAAFTTYGEQLGLEQRDFRVRNNFVDPTANDNAAAQAAFPGQLGAPLAIWKAHAEWSSRPWAGSGAGDGLPGLNPVLGSGAANFDNTFQGVIAGPGGPDSNTHAALEGDAGSTLAFTTLPIADGWTIFYLESWTWDDGPGAPAAGVDLQGVATHEIGHALGLGHSNAPGATMQPAMSADGTPARSLAADDGAGVQAIYGAAAAAKPRITGLAGSGAAGATLQVLGQGFAASGNEAWFTRATASGEPLKVAGLPAQAGGTRIDVVVPAGAADGDVLVRVPGSSGAALSNAWPLDVIPFPVVVQSLQPASGPLGGFTEVQVAGSGLLGVLGVRFGGAAALAYTVESDVLLRATTPPGAAIGPVDVELLHSEGAELLPGAFSYVPDQAAQLAAVTPAAGNKLGGTVVLLDGPSLLGLTEVRFGGVAGTGLQVLDATHAQVTTPPGAAGTVDVLAVAPAGSALLAGGYTYLDLGDFADVGPGLGGWLGVPELAGEGDLTPGSATGCVLRLSGAFPLAATHLFVGTGLGAAPLLGGTFYPLPLLLDLPLASDATGALELPAALPAGTPSGLELVLQAWVADPTLPAGWAASNGLLLHVP